MPLAVAHSLALLAALGQAADRPKADSRPAVFEGVVRGPGGTPVAKARVEALAFPTGRREPVTASVETDSGGRFRLRLEASPPYYVLVEAEGLAPESLFDVPPGRFGVTLANGGTREGIVKDGSTGRPIAGAEVVVYEKTVGDLRQRRANSDARGRFRFDGLRPEAHSVSTRAAGYVKDDRSDVRSRRPVELVLLPGGGVAGVVWGPDQQPLPEVEVDIEPLSRPA